MEGNKIVTKTPPFSSVIEGGTPPLLFLVGYSFLFLVGYCFVYRPRRTTTPHGPRAHRPGLRLGSRGVGRRKSGLRAPFPRGAPV